MFVTWNKDEINKNKKNYLRKLEVEGLKLQTGHK